MEAIILKGSPEEVARFFAQRPELASVQVAHDDAATVPGEVRDWLDEWAIRTPQRPYFEQLISEVVSWEGARHRITRGRKGQTRFAGRIGFVKQGEPQAFAFLLHRGLLILRLDKDLDISEFHYARQRNIKGRRFGIQIYLRSEEELLEARELMRRAYEA